MTILRSLPKIVIAHQSGIMDYYAAIEQAAGPARVFWDEDLGAWMVTGYHECVALLQNKSIAHAAVTLPKNLVVEDLVEFAETVLNSQTMFASGPDVAERRKFWTKVLNGADPSVVSRDPGEIAAEMLANVHPTSPLDAYRSLLQPFVSRVICARLGIDETERIRLYPLIMQYAAFLDGKLWQNEEIHAAYFAIASLYANLAGQSDLFGHAASAPHERICDYVLHLTAGHESTAYLLGTALIHASGESGHLAAAGNDRSRIERVVREASRFDSPVQLIGRHAQGNISIGNRLIKAGDRVFLHVGTANRDRRVFEHPEVFDPQRSGPPALAFGFGRTKCIGHGLAIDESCAFFSALASRGWRLEIDLANVTRISGLAGRSFGALPASWNYLAPQGALDNSVAFGATRSGL